ncbi:MAG: endolytic transglycosylase MltG [Bacteroidia bacterium]|nr:endolytic transglycosylase MltG [Bacteroidia bacterium]
MAKKRKKKFVSRFFIILVSVLVLAGLWYLYQEFWNAKISNGGRYLYVRHGDNIENIGKQLVEMECIQDSKKFLVLARKMELQQHLNPGRYYLRKNATLREIINLIKQKKEDLVELQIPSDFHSMEDFLNFMDGKIESGTEELEEIFLNEEKIWNDFELMKEEAIGILIPGKIRISWAIEPHDLYQFFKNKFYEFWEMPEIKKVLSAHPLQRNQIIILASIVQCESGILSEQRKIAGVYINRLRKNMLLQADPTVVFAAKKWGSPRVYNKDLEIDSPYNTYKYPGLPPGPILNPYLSSIRSVLFYEKHQYYYFCAKPELNGYSNYSKTYDEHLKFARAYQKKMDELKIK